MRYFQTSYPSGVVPGTSNTTAGMMTNLVAGPALQRCTVRMIVPMRSTSGTVVIYNPIDGTTGEVRTNASTNISAGGPYDLGPTAFFIDYTPGSVEFCFWHYTVAMDL